MQDTEQGVTGENGCQDGGRGMLDSQQIAVAFSRHSSKLIVSRELLFHM